MARKTTSTGKRNSSGAAARGQNNHVGRKARSKVPLKISVAKIRSSTGLSQAEFAERFGFAVATLRDWEQGRRHPDRSARLLLRVIEVEPKAVLRALGIG